MGWLLAGGTASADVVNVGTNVYSTLYSGPDANNTNGGGPVFFCGSGPTASGPSGWHDRALLYFDVADNLPLGATVTSAQLTLSMSFAAGSSGSGTATGTDMSYHVMSLYQVTSPWGQDTVSESSHVVSGSNGTGGGTGGGATPTPGLTGATWNQSFYGQTNWNTAGGGGDYNPLPSASQSVGYIGAGTQYTWGSAQLAADVQGWANGTTPNDGWILISNDETMNVSFRNFFSQAGAIAQGQPTWAPDLQITYTVPEPASMALFAVFVPLLLCRRKRKPLNDCIG